MHIKKIMALAAFALTTLAAAAQAPGGKPAGGNAPAAGTPGGTNDETRWEVSVNQMPPDLRRRISRVARDMQHSNGADRGLLTDILKGAGFSTVSSIIDIVANETMNLVKYRKQQKQKWMQMIQNECNYTDSLSAVKGLNDFYTTYSTVGALDPSDMNFDGISIRGMRNNQEVVYLSCHIDTTRIEHLYRHSKFHLVVDTLAFYPLACHLPNVQANGIRTMRQMQKGKDGKKNDKEKNSDERDNSYLFSERQGLSVGMDIKLTSSWINEAVMLMRDVELGNFKLTVNIPDGCSVYTYSRKQIDENRRKTAQQAAPSAWRGKDEPHEQLDTTYLSIEGDCFVVPRSYMPTADGTSRWGTGEYNMKVRFRETCQFSNDATQNEKLRRWHHDYKQLRRMQRKGSEAGEYLRTIWQQNGNTFVKTIVKQALTTSAGAAHLTESSGSGGKGAAGGGAAGAAGGGAAGGQQGGGQMPAGAPH